VRPSLFGRRAPSIEALYGAIVAQARAPIFYRDYGVPDTVNGRFDMIVLHVGLFYLRLAGEAEPLRAQAQAVFDAFCADMDDNFREMGVGDLAVPKAMRRVGEAFYGRLQAYGAALAADDAAALETALARNVFSGAGGANAARLARYVRAAAGALAAQPAGDLTAARLVWPDPGTISGAAPSAE
jgi:cytochrome b pre-mRNA-processing protein 3